MVKKKVRIKDIFIILLDLQFHLALLNDDTVLEVCATKSCSNLTAFDDEHILHKFPPKKCYQLPKY